MNIRKSVGTFFICSIILSGYGLAMDKPPTQTHFWENPKHIRCDPAKIFIVLSALSSEQMPLEGNNMPLQKPRAISKKEMRLPTKSNALPARIRHGQYLRQTPQDGLDKGNLASLAKKKDAGKAHTPPKLLADMNFEEQQIQAFKTLKEKRLLGAYLSLLGEKDRMSRKRERDLKLDLLFASNEDLKISATPYKNLAKELSEEDSYDPYTDSSYESTDDLISSEKSKSSEEDFYSCEYYREYTEDYCADDQEEDPNSYYLPEHEKRFIEDELFSKYNWEKAAENYLKDIEIRLLRTNDAKEKRCDIRNIRKQRKINDIFYTLNEAGFTAEVLRTAPPKVSKNNIEEF